MKRQLVAALFLFGIPCWAQEISRVYVKGPDLFRLIGPDTIRFDDYHKPKGTKQRWITSRDNRYTFTLKSGPQGKYQEVRDKDGTLVGTIYLSGNFKYDVLVPTGERFDWKKISKSSWSYQLDGKTILTGKYIKEGKARKLVHQTTEPIPEILSLSSYERGSELVIGKSFTGTMILVAILVTIVARASL